MSQSEDRVAILRGGYFAWNSGDLEAALKTLHPEVDWYPSPRILDVKSHYHGHAGVREAWTAFTDSFEWYRWEPKQFIQRGDRLAVLGRFRACGRGSGVEVEGDFAHLWLFRSEKVVRWDGDTEKNMEVVSGWD
jgi:ketosteroid isomerase-like protein